LGGASGSLFGPSSAQGGPQGPPPQGPSEQEGPSGSTLPSEGLASQGFKEAPGTLHATACPIIESQLQRFVSYVLAHPFGSTPGRDAVFQERAHDTGTPGWVQPYYATFWETTRQGPNGSILADRVDMADEILQYFSGVPLPMAAPAQAQQVAPPALTVSSALVVCTPTTDMVGLPDQPPGTAISGPAHDVLPGSMLAFGASAIQVRPAAVLQCFETSTEPANPTDAYLQIEPQSECTTAVAPVVRAPCSDIGGFSDSASLPVQVVTVAAAAPLEGIEQCSTLAPTCHTVSSRPGAQQAHGKPKQSVGPPKQELQLVLSQALARTRPGKNRKQDIEPSVLPSLCSPAKDAEPQAGITSTVSVQPPMNAEIRVHDLKLTDTGTCSQDEPTQHSMEIRHFCSKHSRIYVFMS
jgi:hypothetical protein